MNPKKLINLILISAVVILIAVTSYIVLIKRSLISTLAGQLSTQDMNSSVSVTNQDSQVDPQDDSSNVDAKTYRDNSFEFKYPSILTVTSQGENVLISHMVDYKHQDVCDFIGNVPSLDKITDFNTSLRIFNSGLKDTMQANESDNLVNDFFQDDTIITSPGFIDKFNIGSLQGYKITKGVEGCGIYTYYFPLSVNKTLFVSRAFISEFKFNPDVQTYLNVPGVIPPDQEEDFFKTILSSFKEMP